MIKMLSFVLAAVTVVLLLFMVGSYFYFQIQRKDLTSEVRANLPGSFIQLDDGVISYEWYGPQDGPVVVLVHGLSTPKFVWDGNIATLINAGYRVLVFDHYGRGFSDRPEIVYNADLYRRELLNLLDALQITSPVTLVGYSMGGGCVITFASSHPERVKQLILIAPAGFVPEYTGLASLVLSPVLGDWLMTVLGKQSLIADIQKDVEAGKAPRDMLIKFEEQFQYKGYLESILSTMRNYPMNDLSKYYEAVGRSNIPTYAIWGTDDQIVPFSGSQMVKSAIPRAKIFPVEGAGHSVTYARADEVSQIMVALLNSSQ